MRKGWIIALLAALLLTASALADPLTLLPDLADTLCWPDGSDEDSAVFVYRYRYPRVAEGGDIGETVNRYYADEAEYAADFSVAMRGEEILDTSVQSSTEVRYRVTANDDDYFSVLIVADSLLEGERIVNVSAQVFSRDTLKPGLMMTLPYLLDILEEDSNDEWLREHQTERAEAIVRRLVWEALEARRADGEAIPEDLTEESLAELFNPEEDFYYDGETGEIVFFLQPCMNGADMAADDFYAFPFEIDDLIDEL